MKLLWKSGAVSERPALWGATYREPVALEWAEFTPQEGRAGTREFIETSRARVPLTEAEVKAIRWALMAVHEGSSHTQWEAEDPEL